MKYQVDINKLYAWYRIECGLSKGAAEAVMAELDYTQPVVIIEKPALGLSLCDQNGVRAVLPDQVLQHVGTN